MAYADLEIGLHRRDADGYRDTTAADGYADAKWGRRENRREPNRLPIDQAAIRGRSQRRRPH
jgi:hypothetical protein